MTKKRTRSKVAKQRIYWRERGGEKRYYGDFRRLGGKREPLVAKGDKLATNDPEVAALLYGERLKEIMSDKRDAAAGKKAVTKLAEYVEYHLTAKEQSRKFSETWLVDSARMLAIAIEHFGAECDLNAIDVAAVQAYANVLATRPTKRKHSDDAPSVLGPGAIRHHLNVLSSVFERAVSESKVSANPVMAMKDKPSGAPEEAKWLLVHEGALLLESARTYVPKRPDAALPFIYPLIATYLLTGGRETEVLGLEINDINFEQETITFRPNQWRRLKTKRSHRTIPLWPQLTTILKDYIKSTGRKSGLLFPSPLLEKEGMVTDFRKALDAVAVRTGLWKAGDIRSKMFRHTYCASRLQTVDGGQPVAVFTVSRELGHSNTALVEQIYGHVAKAKHRAAVVEYRVTQHRGKLVPYLKLLKAS